MVGTPSTVPFQGVAFDHLHVSRSTTPQPAFPAQQQQQQQQQSPQHQLQTPTPAPSHSVAVAASPPSPAPPQQAHSPSGSSASSSSVLGFLRKKSGPMHGRDRARSMVAPSNSPTEKSGPSSNNVWPHSAPLPIVGGSGSRPSTPRAVSTPAPSPMRRKSLDLDRLLNTTRSSDDLPRVKDKSQQQKPQASSVARPGSNSDQPKQHAQQQPSYQRRPTFSFGISWRQQSLSECSPSTSSTATTASSYASPRKMNSHASLQSSYSTSTSASTAAVSGATMPSLSSSSTASAKLSKTQQRFLRAFPEFTDELVMAVLASSACSTPTNERSSPSQQPTALATPPQTPPETDSFGQPDPMPTPTTGRRKSYDLNAVTHTSSSSHNLSSSSSSTSSPTAPTPMFCLDDFTCALQRDYLWQGTLFVTLTHLCFFGRHFTKTIHIKIHFADLVSIEKEKKLGMIPNTLRIRVRTVCSNDRATVSAAGVVHKSGATVDQDNTTTSVNTSSLPDEASVAEPTKEYVLTSFLSRDQAFAAIERHWNIHKQLQVHQQALLARHRRSMDQLRLQRGHQQQEQGRQQEAVSSESFSNEKDGPSTSPSGSAFAIAAAEQMVHHKDNEVEEDDRRVHVHDRSRPVGDDSALSEPIAPSECLDKLKHMHRLHTSASNSSLRARRKAQRTYSVITSEADVADSSSEQAHAEDDSIDYGTPLTPPISKDTATSYETTLVMEQGMAMEKVESESTLETATSLGHKGQEQKCRVETPTPVTSDPDSITMSATNSSHLTPPKRSGSTSSTHSSSSTSTTTILPSHKRERVTSFSSVASITSDRSSRLMGPPMLISPSLTTTKVSHSSSTIQSTAKEGEPQNMIVHRRDGSQGAILLDEEEFVASSYASSTMSMRSGSLSRRSYQHGSTTATVVEARGMSWGGSQLSLLSTISNSSLESLSSSAKPSARHLHATESSRMPGLQETEEMLLDDDEDDEGAEMHESDDDEDGIGHASVDVDAADDDEDDGFMDEPEEPYPNSPIDCGCQRHYKNTVLSCVIPLSVAMCFEILFSAKGEGEGDRLACDVHRVKDGSTEFKILPWKHESSADETFGHEWENKSRELEYSVSFKVPMLAKTSTACYEVQKILKHTPHLILVHSESRTPNVPYGEHFSTVNQICLSFEAKGQTRVKMFTEVKFKKSIMWSGRVEAGSLEGSGGFWKALIEQLDTVAQDPVFLTRQERLKEEAVEKRKRELAEAKKAASAAAAAAANSIKKHQRDKPKKKTRFQTPPPSRRPTLDLPAPIPISQPLNFTASETSIMSSSLLSTATAPSTKSELPPMVPGGLLATLAAAAAANAAAHPPIPANNGTTPARSLLSLQHLRQLQQQQQLQQIAQQNYRANRASFDSTSSGSSLSTSSGSLPKQQHRIHKTTSVRRSTSQEPHSRTSAIGVGAGGFAAATAFFSLGRSNARKPLLRLHTATGSTTSLSPLPSPSLPVESKGIVTHAPTSAASALLQQQQQCMDAAKEASSSSSLSTLALTASDGSSTGATLTSSEDFMTKLQTTWNGWMADMVRISSSFSTTSQKNASESSDSSDAKATVKSALQNETASPAGGDLAADSDTLARSQEGNADVGSSTNDSAVDDEESTETAGIDDMNSTEEETDATAATLTTALACTKTVDKGHRAVSSVLFLCVILVLMVSALNVLKLMKVVSSMVQVVEIRHQWTVAHQQVPTQPLNKGDQGTTGMPPPVPLIKHHHHHYHHHHHHYYPGEDGSVMVKRQRIQESGPLDDLVNTLVLSPSSLSSSSSSWPSSVGATPAITSEKSSPTSLHTSSFSTSASAAERRNQTLREIRAQTQALRNEVEALKRQLEEGVVN